MLCVCFSTSQHARPVYLPACLPACFDVVSNFGRFAIVSFKVIQWIHHAQQIASWIQHARINSYYWISILPSHHHMPVHVFAIATKINQTIRNNILTKWHLVDDLMIEIDRMIYTYLLLCPKMCVTIQAIALFNRWWCRTHYRLINVQWFQNRTICVNVYMNW